MSKFDIHKWNADRRGASLNEGVAEFIGDGVIKIMDYAFFSVIADNEEAFSLLMDTLENATNEDKLEMLTNLAKFRLKPTLMKLAQAELANMSNKQDQLRKAFREEALNEGNSNKWSVIYTSPRGAESKYYYSSEEEARKNADNIKKYDEPGWKSIVVEPENK